MNDMSAIIVPKSDQWNADDLIAGPRTIRIADVRISPGTEQPVSIGIEGEQKVFRPCKSMSRVLVAAWGPDAKAYVGRSITLYRDPAVKWGGMEVGGIRISHLSHLGREMVMALTATKGKRAPYSVKPLAVQEQAPAADPAAKWTDGYIAKVEACDTLDALAELEAERAAKLTELREKRTDLYDRVRDVTRARYDALSPGEGRADEQHGDQHDGSER